VTTPDFAGALDTLRLDLDGHVGWLRLHRPEKLNSFTIQMWTELRELGARLAADPGELRALVVIGDGRAFSSGIDTSVFTEGAMTAGPPDAGAPDAGAPDAGTTADHAALPLHDSVVATVRQTQAAYTWLHEAPFATIAAVRGYALGAGLQIALACDMRVIARGTSLGLLEFKYGIIPDLGGTQRLPALVGAGKAKELIFTAARMDAEEAGRIGLAERVVADEELEDVAGDLAATIAAQPPLAVRGAKRAINAASELPERDGLVVEAEAQSACLRSDDMKEAIAAFVEQRAPVYRGR
jgi:enoyl-CoA hydratase/carnithine racemase